MKSATSRLRHSHECAYFAASNSRYGFHSYYESCFRGKADRLFCIKGGPGTGKSWLMREVARAGERAGFKARYYYCSSDADSLDAVMLQRGDTCIGLLDATAPHVFEPHQPGTVEDILDLGALWDSAMLAQQREKIDTYNAKKSVAYRTAYHYLAAAGAVCDALQEHLTPCLNEPKINRTAARLLRGVGKRPTTDDNPPQIALCDSIGMRGRVRLDTYHHAGRICFLVDCYGAAYACTSRLCALAAERRLRRRVSYHPLLPDRVDALYLEDCDTAFIVIERAADAVCSESTTVYRVLHTRSLLLREPLTLAKPTLRADTRLRDQLLSRALEELSRVADAHFRLEALYAAAMDFTAKERLTEQLCHRLFGTPRADE